MIIQQLNMAVTFHIRKLLCEVKSPEITGLSRSYSVSQRFLLKQVTRNRLETPKPIAITSNTLYYLHRSRASRPLPSKMREG